MLETSALKHRIDRAHYWQWSGLCLLAAIVALSAVVLTANQTSRAPVNVPATVAALAGAFVFVASCVALFVVGVWRLRDRGKSGFWIVLYYALPFVLAVASIDPHGQRGALGLAALALFGWAMIDLGILDKQAADPVGS
jgi:uncharacterized membrane protein YhaH (DUF805 family)